MAIEIGNKNTAILPANSSWSLRGAKTIKASERMFFIEQLALMLETGNDLHRSLKTLRKQCKNPLLEKVIGEICDDISEGKPFSVALAKHPDIFSTTYVSLVAASESGGYLQRILDHLVEMERRRDELNTMLLSAAAYPAVLVLVSIVMVIFILTEVFPKFADLFSSIQDQLPITTIILMKLSDIILAYWWALLLGGGVLLAGLISWLKSEAGGRMVSTVQIKVPLVKHLFIRLYLVRTLRVIGLSLMHGVNLINALDVAKDVVNNYLFHGFIDKLIKNVNEGRNLADGFNEAEFIPPMVAQMIATGEETGNLALVSIRIADYIQKELEKLLKFITKVIEPFMLIVMGAIVGLLVSALILPIFKLSHVVQ